MSVQLNRSEGLLPETNSIGKYFSAQKNPDAFYLRVTVSAVFRTPIRPKKKKKPSDPHLALQSPARPTEYKAPLSPKMHPKHTLNPLPKRKINIYIYIYAFRPICRLHFCCFLVWLPIPDFLCSERIKVVLLSGLGSLPSSPVLSFLSMSFVVDSDCVFRV